LLFFFFRYVADPNRYCDWNEAVSAKLSTAVTRTSSQTPQMGVTQGNPEDYSPHWDVPVPGQVINLKINLFPYCCFRVPSVERVHTVDTANKAISWRKPVDCFLETDRWQVVVPLGDSGGSASPNGRFNHTDQRRRCIYLTALSIPGITGSISYLAFSRQILRCFEQFGASLNVRTASGERTPESFRPQAGQHANLHKTLDANNVQS
jgi:hypothetical protein